MSKTIVTASAGIGKVIAWIVGIIVGLVVIVGAAGLLVFSAATKDTMPAAPTAEPTEISTFAVDAAKEVVTTKKITVEAADIDAILAEVKTTANASANGLFEIKELFCQLDGNMGNIYARIYLGTVTVSGMDIKVDKVVPVQASFAVDFEGTSIVILLDKVKCGSITIPQGIIDTALGAVTLPEELSVKNGNIYYDTANLDNMIDGVLTASIENAVSNSGVVDFLGKLFGEDAASNIASEVSGGISGLASNATNVELYNAYIEEGKLIIEGKVF